MCRWSKKGRKKTTKTKRKQEVEEWLSAPTHADRQGAPVLFLRTQWLVATRQNPNLLLCGGFFLVAWKTFFILNPIYSEPPQLFSNLCLYFSDYRRCLSSSSHTQTHATSIKCSLLWRLKIQRVSESAKTRSYAIGYRWSSMWYCVPAIQWLAWMSTNFSLILTQ